MKTDFLASGNHIFLFSNIKLSSIFTAVSKKIRNWFPLARKSVTLVTKTGFINLNDGFHLKGKRLPLARKSISTDWNEGLPWKRRFH